MRQWKNDYAVSTAHMMACYLRRLLRFIGTLGGPDLSKEVPRTAAPQARHVTITPEKWRELTATAEPWLRLFALLAYQLGLRRSEIFRVCPATWNREAHTITIQRKRKKVRTLPTTAEIEQLFEAAGCPPNEQFTAFVWILKGPNHNGSYGLSHEQLYAYWHKLTARCGVPDLNPHDLRRTTINLMYQLSDNDLRAAQAFADHTSMTSTIWYLSPLGDRRLADLHKLLIAPMKTETKQ